MTTSSRCVWIGVGCGLAIAAASVSAQIDPDTKAWEGHLPRNMTALEQQLIREHPLMVTDAPTPPPTGPVVCPGEYAPADGVLLSWNGSGSWLTIVREMAKNITTIGNAKAYVVCPTASAQTSAMTSISAAGANMALVEFIVQPTNTIWIRDYGPRYAYEGDCRIVVDHTYNRPRPQDNLVPKAFGAFKGHKVYELDLIHGGGNYQLDSETNAFSTQLIVNENPGKTAAQIQQIWNNYQNVNTTVTGAFPTNIDATQHIDMWVQIVGDQRAMINDYPLASGQSHDVIADQLASGLTNAGWNVTRLPAFNSGGTHYTYANVCMVNDLILVPTYTVSQATSTYNAQALAAWQTAMPGKTIVQINCQAIVTAAGVMHCICMHVPVHLGGVNPTAYLKTVNDGSFSPGESVVVDFISDDDVGVTSIDVRLSIDGGLTYPYLIASGQDPTQQYQWSVDRLPTMQGKVQIVAHDAHGNTGSDSSDSTFVIDGCYTDCDGNGALNVFDYICFGGSYASNQPYADCDANGSLNVFDYICFGNAYVAGCP